MENLLINLNNFFDKNNFCGLVILVFLFIFSGIIIFNIGKKYNKKNGNEFYKDLKDIFIASIPFILIMNYGGKIIHNSSYGTLLIILISFVSFLVLISTILYSVSLLKKYNKNKLSIKILTYFYIIILFLYYIFGIILSTSNIKGGQDNKKVSTNIKQQIINIKRDIKEIKSDINKIKNKLNIK